MTAIIHLGDCREIIATLDDNSIDSIVTDPPYELGFMGKKWDASGIAYNVELWAECLRVLKPGGHLLAFGGTRTYHRMTCAIEDAGFEIRDSIHWLYGSGFPKSHDVSKGIDKAAGAEREVVGSRKKLESYGKGNAVFGSGPNHGGIQQITAPATDAAREWEGWGTALKPAHEPVVMARKPFTGTVAANVLEHGTGAINIDGTRIPMGDEYDPTKIQRQQNSAGAIKGAFGAASLIGKEIQTYKPGGRWPANLIIDEHIADIETDWPRYFYTSKTSKAERNAAGPNNHPTCKPLDLMRYLIRLVTPPGGHILEPFAGSGTTMAAAILENFDVTGCELTADYLPIINARIQWAQQQTQPDPESLFNQ